MIYLLAIVVLALVAIVGFQIYSVIETDQKKIEQVTEDEPSVMDNKIDYQTRLHALQLDQSCFILI
jgi:hypothetical protein